MKRALLLFLLAGCAEVKLLGARCDPADGGCLETGLYCVAGRCVATPAVEDAGVDAGVDGGVDAGCVKKLPNLMVTLDISGSMNQVLFPVPQDAGCTTCAFPSCNEAFCPTRMGATKAALTDLFTRHSTDFRTGFAVFPTGGAVFCGAENPVLVHVPTSNDVSSELLENVGLLRDAGQRVTPFGGTPTGQVLDQLRQYPPLDDPTRRDYVLLITDGLPNCDENNPNTCSTSGCQCTIAPGICSGMYCVLGCLDANRPVANVVALASKGISTIVVTLADDPMFGNPGLFAQMALQGKYPRVCDGGFPCGSQPYKASNAAQLIEVFDDIAATIGGPQCAN